MNPVSYPSSGRGDGWHFVLHRFVIELRHAARGAETSHTGTTGIPAAECPCCRSVSARCGLRVRLQPQLTTHLLVEDVEAVAPFVQLTFQLVRTAPIGLESFANGISRRIAIDGLLLIEVLIIKVHIAARQLIDAACQRPSSRSTPCCSANRLSKLSTGRVWALALRIEVAAVVGAGRRVARFRQVHRAAKAAALTPPRRCRRLVPGGSACDRA